MKKNAQQQQIRTDLDIYMEESIWPWVEGDAFDILGW